mgnify:FL=1
MIPSVTNRKLAIGLPLSFPMVHAGFLDSMMTLERPDFIYLRANNGPVDGLRNKLVLDAMTHGCSHLIMMDCDQTYPPDTIPRLLAHNLPVVGCLIFRRYPPFDPLMLRGPVGKYRTIEEWEPGSLVEVDATGTGCLMFDMRLFYDLPQPWFKFRPSPDPESSSMMGEDIGFCYDIKQAGYKIFVDTAVQCGHLSTMEVQEGTWRFYGNLKRQQRALKLKEQQSKED